MSKRLTKSDRAILMNLLTRYPATVLTRALQRIGTSRKTGRPKDNAGNLAGVFGYISCWSRRARPGGRRYGIEGAATKLKGVLEKHTVGFRLTKGRLKT